MFIACAYVRYLTLKILFFLMKQLFFVDLALQAAFSSSFPDQSVYHFLQWNFGMYPMVRLIYDKHLFSPNVSIHCQEKWLRDLIK